MIVLSYDRDPVSEANYIEYCNGDTSTVYGKLRAQHNGAVEPYNIKYWEIDNEAYQYYTPEVLSERLLLNMKELRKKDSSITLIANGDLYATDYIERMFNVLGDKVDVYGVHFMNGTVGRKIEDDEK